MSVKDNCNTFITLVFVLLLIPFLSITGIKNIVDTMVYQAWQIAAVAVLLVLVYLLASEIKINWAVALFTLYHAIILFSSYLNHGFSSGIVVVTVATILLFMLMQTPYYREIICALCIIMVFSVIINLPIMISKLGDENALFFIGGKNALSIVLVPATFLFFINSLEAEGRIGVKSFAFLALCLLSIIIGGSGTGIVVVFLTILFSILIIKFEVKKWLCIFLIILLNSLLLVFSSVFFETDFWIFFTGLLGKNNDLTSRVTIWNIVKEMVADNWLVGPGRGTEISYINRWGEQKLMYESHNFILEILMEGGVMALTVFSGLFYNIINKLNMADIRNKIVFVALCAILINGLTESTVNNFFVTIVLGVACHYAIENQGKTVSNG